jgi:hypothetical protein
LPVIISRDPTRLKVLVAFAYAIDDFDADTYDTRYR